VPISGYVVNRVLPAELTHGNLPSYLRNRIGMQERYLDEIATTFGNQILAYVPEMERDITGLPMIERLAQRLFAGA
jgi:arsenite-transporting ATPase